MISALDISLARGIDALAIAQMSRQRIEDGLPWRWTPERVARNLARAHTNAIVGRIDGELAGFALMAYGEQEAHLLLMAVSAPRARQGVGSRLLRWLDATLEVAGITTTVVEARADNGGALAFYARHGFGETQRVRGYYEGQVDGVRMTRERGGGQAGTGAATTGR